MEAYRITIHQAFYGEVNRSHSCIQQTLNDPELTSFLIAFTDRPAALPPGINLVPYLSGTAYSQYFILTKTFPDSSATRAGMVFTHALIIDLIDITSLNNLRNILTLFVESPDSKGDGLYILQIVPSGTNFLSKSNVRPKYVQQVVASFLREGRPILFSGEIQTFSLVVEQIWSSLDIESRKRLKFRTSFTPSDIEDARDLTIVSIQKEFLSKWQGRSIVNGGEDELLKITSDAEALFLDNQARNPFYDFLSDLNISPYDFGNFKQYEKVFTNYISIESIEDANLIRLDIRAISRYSPSPNIGKNIKDAFIDRLQTLISSGKDSNVKALRNIDWSGFRNGEEKGRQVVSHFVKSEIERPNLVNTEALAELIDLSVRETPKNWWHESLKAAVEAAFKKPTESVLRNVWSLMDSSVNNLDNLLSIVDSVKDFEVVLRTSLPDILRNETLVALTVIAERKDWQLLHADVLLRQFSTEFALEKQLAVEKGMSLLDSVGIHYISEKLPPEALLSLTLKCGDKKLIRLSANAISQNILLLRDIDLKVSCWLEIWTSLVEDSRKIFEGLAGRERETVFTVLDLILEGKKLDQMLIDLMADSSFADISDYENRDKVWEALEASVRNKFLIPTTQTILAKLIAGEITENSIESEVSDQITSDSQMTQFLDENMDHIEPVIKIYESFANLRDNFLADYITYYRYGISQTQATELGNLVLKNNFTKSARSIYDKMRYNNTFEPTYHICKEIVDVNWLESMWGSVGALFVPSAQPQPIVPYSKSLDAETMLILNLPTVVILTAINVEYIAVRNHLNDVVDAIHDDTTYEAGIFEFNGRKVAKVFIRECGAKNNIAAQETERAINNFKPAMILFVGIAGSRKPNDFSVGDVIFPEKVYSYEAGKSEENSFLARPDSAFTSYALLELAKKERRNEHWKSLIKGTWEQEVKADLGIIASGEGLIEHFDSDIGKILTRHYNDTSAVEMEGFGFGKAASRQGREAGNMQIGVIRGISDILVRPSKNKHSTKIDRRPADAKRIASDTSAAFAFWLIFRFFDNPKIEQS